MKLQLNDEKTRVDPWSHIDTFEGWTVLTETIVLYSKFNLIKCAPILSPLSITWIRNKKITKYPT